MSNSLRKPRVFVSSTMQDLRRHRETAIKQLKSSDCIVDAMEDWTATNKSPVEYSTDRAKESDLLILLVGSRMGHKPSGLDKSITRLEYEAAMSNDCAIHVYLLEDQYLGADIKEDPDFADLMQFREMLKESFTVGWFNPEHTSIDVTPALVRWLLENIALQPAVTYLPRARNPNFLGRDALFSILNSFSSTSGPGKTQILVGMGGVGKSQLALEFAYGFRDRYATVWWINAETREEQLQGLKDLAVAIDLPETQGTESETQAKAAVRWLNSHPGWLLIVDNAIDAKSVSDLLPDSSNGHTIITSRNPSWGNIGEVVEVPPLSRVNAIDFLIGGSSQRDEYSAGLVAAELGDLPLALEQARAYMESRGLEIAKYLEIYKKHGKRIREIDESPYYPASIATTWSMAMDEISARFPIAEILLECMSLLSSNHVYLDFFAKQTPISTEKDGFGVVLFNIQELKDLQLQWDEFELIEAGSAIRKYALASGTNDCLTMHRVVRAVIRDSIEQDREIQLIKNLICRLVSVPTSFFKYDYDARISNIRAHVGELVKESLKLELEGKEACNLYYNYSRYRIENIEGKASLALVRALAKKNYQMAIGSYGENSPESAATLALLSYVNARFGKKEEAMDGYKDLEYRIKSIQSQFPMEAANCLATASQDLDRVWFNSEAEKFASWSLDIARSNLDKDDINLCYYLFVCGSAYLYSNPEKSESILREAVKLGSGLEEDHELVLACIGLLGDTLCRLGKFEQAVELSEKALKSWINKHGEESSSVGFRQYKLMSVYHMAGRYEDAVEAGMRAAEIVEKSSGAPDRLSEVWFYLSKVYKSMEDYVEAVKYIDLAIDMTSRTLGNVVELVAYYDYLADYASHLSWYEVLNEAIAGMRRVLDESNIADKDYWYVKAMYWQLYSNFWEHKFEEAQVDCVSALGLALKLEQKSHVRKLVKDIAFWERLIHEQVIERDSISGIYRSEMISTLRQKHSAILDSAELDSVDERVNSWIGRKTCTDEG